MELTTQPEPMMCISIEIIRERLGVISDLLGTTLNETLDMFELDSYTANALTPYLDEWGDKTLHEFAMFWKTEVGMNELDPNNGDVEPFNIFGVLVIIYDIL